MSGGDFDLRLKMGVVPLLCKECRSLHGENIPHKNTLFYRTNFKINHGREPDWMDAVDHCSEEVQQEFAEAIMIKRAKNIIAEGRSK